MKVTNVTNDNSFEPVKILLTLESEDEVVALYTVMNYSPVTMAIRAIAPGFNIDGIRRALGNVNYDKSWKKFTDAIKDRV